VTRTNTALLASLLVGSGLATAAGCHASAASSSSHAAGGASGAGGDASSSGAGTGGGAADAGPTYPPPAEKLLAWLKLDDGAGVVATDSSGNGNDATLSEPDGGGGDAGVSAWTTGAIGGALSLDGVGRLAMAHDILGASAFTFCSWYDTTTAPWGSVLVSNGAFEVYVGTGAFEGSSDGTHGAQSAPATLPPVRWSHVCVTRDATGQMGFFVNGMASGGGPSGTPTAGLSNVTFGNHPWKPAGWAVTLDDVRLYEGILTLDEVRSLYLLGVTNPQPKTVTAASCAEADVQAAINRTSFGDTVAIPAGSCTWTTTLSVGTPLTLQGAGIGTTTLVDGVDVTSTVNPHQVLTLGATFAGLVRLTNLTLEGGTGPDDAYNKGMLSVSGSEGPWRVDHVRFHANHTAAVEVYTSGGVIDHNQFDLDGWHYGVYGFNGGDFYGDLAWTQPLDLGGSNAYFVEDNVFTEIQTSAGSYSVASDGWNGQRVVFRHNTLDNVIWGNHGTESSGLLRGARAFEIYDNTMTYTSTVGALPYAMGFRSGNGVIWGNVMTGLPYGAIYTDNYRDWSPFAPWGQCDGTSPYDDNDPMTYDTGTQTAANGTTEVDGNITLTDATKSWTPNQWVGYSVRDTTRGDGSIIVSSTTTTLTARWDNTHNPIPLSFAVGDAYVITRAKACIDQMGRGVGALVARDPTTGVPTVAAWPNQAAEPAWAWGNTNNGARVKLSSGSPHVVDGTDFNNDACPPGYAPYAYPHPLTGAPAQPQPTSCP